MLEEKMEEEIKKLVIARLSTLDPNSKILLLGGTEPISVRDMINEITKDSELGRQIVEVQFSYLKMLTSGGLDK